MAQQKRKPLPQFAPEPEAKVMPVENDAEDFSDLVGDAPSEPTTETDHARDETAASGSREPEPVAGVVASDHPPEAGGLDEESVAGVESSLADAGVPDLSPITPRDCRYMTIDTAPKVGIQMVVSEMGLDEGVRALWKRSRFFEKGRWQMTGKWIEPITGKDIGFEPKYWRELS